MGGADESFWKMFRAELKEIDEEIVRLRHQLDSPAQEYFLHRLMMAHENATGAILLGEAGLSTPLIVIGRALFESLIVTYWASLSDQNTAEAMGTTQREVIRILRRTVDEGRGRIIHKVTGKTENARLMNHPMIKEGRRPKRLDQMAKEARIKNIYDMLYGLLSLFAHGTAAKMHMDIVLSQGPPIYEHMSLVRCCMKGIALVCGNRIQGRQTARTELEVVLKVKLLD